MSYLSKTPSFQNGMLCIPYCIFIFYLGIRILYSSQPEIKEKEKYEQF